MKDNEIKKEDKKIVKIQFLLPNNNQYFNER